MPVKGLFSDIEDPIGGPEGLVLPPDLNAVDGPLAGGAEEAVVLSLSDLVPDEQGEVVLFNDADAPVTIAADRPVIATGLAEPHVTAAGIDVTGMQYSSFDTGVTVYHDPDVPFTVE